MGQTLLAGAVLSVACIASALAQTQWSSVDCSGSDIKFSEGYKCFSSTDVNPSNSLIRNRYAQVQGWNDDFYIRLTYFIITGYFSAYSTADSEKFTKDFVVRAEKGAIQWAAYSGFGDTGYIPFRVGSIDCIAIDHGGAKTSGNVGQAGYSFILRGYICDKRGIPAPELVVKRTLAALILEGPGRGKNAFGDAPQGFSRVQTTATARTPASTPANAAVPAPPAVGKVETDLAAIKALHEKGLITKEEYDAKRKEILGRM